MMLLLDDLWLLLHDLFGFCWFTTLVKGMFRFCVLLCYWLLCYELVGGWLVGVTCINFVCNALIACYGWLMDLQLFCLWVWVFWFWLINWFLEVLYGDMLVCYSLFWCFWLVFALFRACRWCGVLGRCLVTLNCLFVILYFVVVWVVCPESLLGGLNCFVLFFVLNLLSLTYLVVLL